MLVDGSRIYPRHSHGGVREQLPLEGQRELVHLGLFLVRIDDAEDRARDRPEIGAVWIKVDLAGFVQSVAVVVVPIPDRNRKHVLVDVGDVRLQLAQLIEAPIPALEDGLAVARHVERDVGARRDRVEYHELNRIPALGSGKGCGIAALRRRVRVVMLDADSQVHRQPPSESPRVLPVHADIVAMVRAADRSVNRGELEGYAIIEPELVAELARFSANSEVVKPAPQVVDPRFDVVVASEQVPLVPADNTFRVMTAFVRSTPVGVGALEEQVPSHKLSPNVHGRDLPGRDAVVDLVDGVVRAEVRIRRGVALRAVAEVTGRARVAARTAVGERVERLARAFAPCAARRLRQADPSGARAGLHHLGGGLRERPPDAGRGASRLRGVVSRSRCLAHAGGPGVPSGSNASRMSRVTFWYLPPPKNQSLFRMIRPPRLPATSCTVWSFGNLIPIATSSLPMLFASSFGPDPYSTAMP